MLSFCEDYIYNMGTASLGGSKFGSFSRFLVLFLQSQFPKSLLEAESISNNSEQLNNCCAGKPNPWWKGLQYSGSMSWHESWLSLNSKTLCNHNEQNYPRWLRRKSFWTKFISLECDRWKGKLTTKNGEEEKEKGIVFHIYHV